MYSKVGLYNHNIRSYEKIKSAFEQGENIVGIVHATGTGKTYNALELAYDNKDKKTLYIVPSNSIIEHIKQTIRDNPNLSLEEDFKNVEFKTYQSLINMSDEELKNLNYDYLVIDEFHHIGAPIWGKQIKKIIDSHPNLKVLGMTAYTVRDRGTIFERDMANPATDELFSNKIVSRYDLCDAMIDLVLPKPIYRSAHINLINLVNSIEKRLSPSNLEQSEYQKYRNLIHDIKKRISEAPGIEELIRKNIKKDGKYIYFCPTNSENGVNDIDTIMKEAKEWFKKYIPEEDIVFYKTTSADGNYGKINRKAFYNDVTLNGESADGKLRVMFAINQYNEGVHAPNIDGVIMGRSTSSDIIFFEQLGRALSVRGDIKKKIEEYSNYSREELVEFANIREIPIYDYMTEVDIIEKLVAPIIIDLTNNFDFMKDLENNLKNRIKESKEYSTYGHRDVKLKNAIFDIDIENKDIFEMLMYLRERLAPRTWNDWYELAFQYYEKNKNLDIRWDFKTFNGYEYNEKGLELGKWIINQRSAFNKDMLSKEKIDKLSLIGMDFSNQKKKMPSWDEMYSLAKEYYEYYGNLDVKSDFKTLNGYEYNEEGHKLGTWILEQRALYRSTMGVLYANNQGFYSKEESIKRLNKCAENLNRINMLLELNFILDIKENRANVKNKCKQYRIKYETYSKILGKMSVYELIAKISYLQDHNIPVSYRGVPNKIILANKQELESKYKIDFNKLMTDYYIEPILKKYLKKYTI